MKVVEYFKDKLIIIVINLTLFVVISWVMNVIKVNYVVILVIFCIWFIPLLSYMLWEAIKYKRYYNHIEKILEGLDKKYLIPEVLDEANFIEGRIFNELFKEVGRDMHENVKFYREMQEDYREYIETWVHEIKTPIASAKLIIENNKSPVTSKIDIQMDRIEGFIEQVLYYSRSRDVSKDYIIKKIDIGASVRNVVKRNYRDFIVKKIKIDMRNLDKTVYSDSKWIEFILNQIVGNSIKYSSTQDPFISIYTEEYQNSLILTIEDNGVGIPDNDIDRVFEKGFTGENGRYFGKSTGMGLYLCKSLCEKLGIGIHLESEKQKGTKVKMIFPISNMIRNSY